MLCSTIMFLHSNKTPKGIYYSFFKYKGDSRLKAQFFPVLLMQLCQRCDGHNVSSREGERSGVLGEKEGIISP